MSAADVASLRPADVERFWAQVNKTETCWLWTGTLLASGGYGRFSFASRQSAQAHRLSYEMAYGALPAGIWVTRSCEEKACVRPDHLSTHSPKWSRVCDVANCDRRSSGKYCSGHWTRLRVHGDLRPDEPIQTSPRQSSEVCLIDDCHGKPRAKNYCSAHYGRLVRYGDPTYAPPIIRTGSINANGYRVIRSDGRQRLEHRVIMEQHLGRPLLADENVHHINGSRADNRLENLELWSTAQPAGQRVADKVAWAQMILKRYAS